MGEERYTYDAFISYRHLPLDMAVAKRLQELLERYRPPRQLKTAHTDRIRRGIPGPDGAADQRRPGGRISRRLFLQSGTWW